jgi:hypothetical protein
MTKDERIEKESELYRLYEGANPFETEVELKDRIAELEADLDVSCSGTAIQRFALKPSGDLHQTQRRSAKVRGTATESRAEGYKLVRCRKILRVQP